MIKDKATSSLIGDEIRICQKKYLHGRGSFLAVKLLGPVHGKAAW